MGWTTGKTTAQMVTVLTGAGALTDQALTALHSLAHRPNRITELWGTLVQCTSGWNTGDPVFEFDSTPAFGNTNQTLAQVTAALVTAGALQDQAVNALHGLAWQPNQPSTLWGVLVKCTSGWNTTASPVFSYTANPS